MLPLAVFSFWRVNKKSKEMHMNIDGNHKVDIMEMVKEKCKVFPQVPVTWK